MQRVRPAQNAVFYVLIIVAMLTLVSNMVSWSMGAVETLGAIGMEERSPKLLGHKHKKFGTNDYSYIVMGVISTALVVVNFSLSGDANDVFWNIFAFSTLVFMLPYLWLFPAAWKLRKSDPGTERVYKAPALGLCVVLGEACMAVAVFFLFYVPFDPLYHGMLIVGTIITTLIGFKLYNNGKKQKITDRWGRIPVKNKEDKPKPKGSRAVAATVIVLAVAVVAGVLGRAGLGRIDRPRCGRHRHRERRAGPAAGPLTLIRPL